MGSSDCTLFSSILSLSFDLNNFRKINETKAWAASLFLSGSFLVTVDCHVERIMCIQKPMDWKGESKN